jgi:hypothetical protein
VDTLTIRDTLAELGGYLYLATPVLVTTTLVQYRSTRRQQIAFGSGAVLFVVLLCALTYGHYSGIELSPVLHQAVGIGFFWPAFPFPYFVLTLVPLAGGLVGLLSGDSARVQAGAGLWLISAAGYDPRSPGRSLFMVLGAALLMRASIALGQRIVRGRSSMA